MAEIKDYSVTADDNNATSPAGMPENMAPSGVNNSWRESFARVKRWYEDINGTKSTTGSSNAYVLAAARTVTAYAQGDAYLFRANFTNTAAVTLNVDSVGAVAIVNNTQSALAAGQIQSGGMYLVAYDATNSKFQLVGASATSASGDNIFIFNASPSATLENSTAEDTAGGRESTIQWKGLQSGSEESTLVKIIGSHDGTADDQKGKLQIYTNDGADGDSPTLQVTIDSAGLCALVGAATIGGTLTVTGVTTHGGNVVSDTDSTDDLGTTGVRWANLFVDAITVTDQVTATGFTGTLDGILGSGAAAAATVTTLDTSGVVNLNLTTDSSSSTSGALIIDGGVGIAKKLFVGTDADIDGTLEADAITLNGTALGSLYSPIAGSSSIVTTGALNSGSITSGFGAIDNGASAITTTGAVSGGTITGSTSVKTPLIEYTDGDDAITIADGGGTTFAQTAAIPAITGLTSINSGQIGGSRNKIINGAMVIDQRNAGSAVNISAGTTTYSLDRYGFFLGTTSAVATIQQDSSAPANFTNSLKISVNTADASVAADDRARITQRIEGYNFADLNYGSASARTLTLSFWVKSNLTDTFSVVFYNAANNRMMLKTYTTEVANTWEQKTITITGDTTGTWLKTNGNGINIAFNLMAGSSQQGTADSWQATGGAYGTSSQANLFSSTSNTFYLTGVQLEVGSTATEFEHRSYGEELALCQRYYYKNKADTTNSTFGSGFNDTTTTAFSVLSFPVSMRDAPSALEQTGTASNYRLRTGSAVSATCNSVPTFVGSSTDSAWTKFFVASGLTAGQGAIVRANSTAAFLAWSAEL